MRPFCAQFAVVFALITTVHAQTWQALNPKGGDFLGTKTDPSNPQSMIAIMRSPNAAFQSADGGASWTKLADIPTTDTLRQMCAFDMARLYAVTNAGCYRSANGGRSWQYSAFPAGGVARACACVPTNANKVYAVGYKGATASADPVFFQSSDGGVTWSSTTLPRTLNAGILQSIAVSAANPNVIFAAGYQSTNSYTGDLLLRSTNSGASWTDLSAGLDDPDFAGITSVAVDPMNPQRIYVATMRRFFSSADGGNTWGTPVSVGGLAIAIDPVTPSIILIGAEGFVSTSTDSGQHWVYSQSCKVRGEVHGIDIAPSQPAKVRVSTDQGLFGSNDRGATWGGIYTGLARTRSFFIGIAPSNHSILVAGGSVETDACTIYSSSNGGAQWAEKASFIGDDIYDLLVHPLNPNRMIAIFEYPLGGVFLTRSVDGGSNWSTNLLSFFMNGAAKCLAQDPARAEVIYAGGGDGRFTVCKSLDFGTTWSAPRELAGSLESPSTCRDIEVAPANPDVVYAVGEQTFNPHAVNAYTTPRVFRSHDAGASWTEISSNLLSLQPIVRMLYAPCAAYAVEVHPMNPDRVYLGTNLGLFYTSNAGQLWSATGLKKAVSGLEFNSRDNTLYACTFSEGVYANVGGSLDNWQPINDGLGSLQCRCIKFDAVSRTLYVGTLDRGVWRATIPVKAGAKPVWARYQ